MICKGLLPVISRSSTVGRPTLSLWGLAAFCCASHAFLSGCSVASTAAAGISDNLSQAIVNQPDPELVGDALPAYLLLIDGFALTEPGNAGILGSAAQLYALYATTLVPDEARAAALAARAKDYGDRALCAEVSRTCELAQLNFDDYVAAIGKIGPSSSEALFSYCVGNLSFIRTNTDDWNALADLPKLEYALEHLLSIGADQKAGSVNMYLGILNTLRPEALGGHPERGRAYFETAIELTEGRDLAVKVEFAKGYARMLYDRELHDQLLNDVLAAEVQQPGFTFFNQLAQQQAVELLATADDYF